MVACEARDPRRVGRLPRPARRPLPVPRTLGDRHPEPRGVRRVRRGRRLPRGARSGRRRCRRDRARRPDHRGVRRDRRARTDAGHPVPGGPGVDPAGTAVRRSRHRPAGRADLRRSRYGWATSILGTRRRRSRSAGSSPGTGTTTRWNCSSGWTPGNRRRRPDRLLPLPHARRGRSGPRRADRPGLRPAGHGCGVFPPEHSERTTHAHPDPGRRRVPRMADRDAVLATRPRGSRRRQLPASPRAPGSRHGLAHADRRRAARPRRRLEGRHRSGDRRSPRATSPNGTSPSGCSASSSPRRSCTTARCPARPTP